MEPTVPRSKPAGGSAGGGKAGPEITVRPPETTGIGPRAELRVAMPAGTRPMKPVLPANPVPPEQRNATW